jgi:predicted dehydrogenase
MSAECCFETGGALNPVGPNARVRWGVLGAARIATTKVIPGMQRGAHCEIVAIASRDGARAADAAAALAIPRHYASYDALLADPDIDAVYIPLPNHMHVAWGTRAAEHGKHVLCEKPIAMSAAEAAMLLAVRERTGVRIQEAFMIRAHPQWITAMQFAHGGRIGEVRALAGWFSYHNVSADNIRNIAEYGGGALMDIGCYLVHAARWTFGREPARVVASIDLDARFGTDRLTSMLLDFGESHAVGACATQLVAHQRVQIIGTRGRIEIEIPFNAPPDAPSRIFIDDGSRLGGAAAEVITFPACDQYTLQGDAFARAIIDGAPQPLPLEDAVANMRVIDALVRSGAAREWMRVGHG